MADILEAAKPVSVDAGADIIQQAIAGLKCIVVDDSFGEMQEQAAEVKETTLEHFAEALAAAIKKSNEAAIAEQQRLDAIAREKDTKHKKTINLAAVACLMKACEMSEADAKKVVVAIAKKKITHISIQY